MMISQCDFMHWTSDMLPRNTKLCSFTLRYDCLSLPPLLQPSVRGSESNAQYLPLPLSQFVSLTRTEEPPFLGLTLRPVARIWLAHVAPWALRLHRVLRCPRVARHKGKSKPCMSASRRLCFSSASSSEPFSRADPSFSSVSSCNPQQLCLVSVRPQLVGRVPAQHRATTPMHFATFSPE